MGFFRKCSYGHGQPMPPSNGYTVEVPVSKAMQVKGSDEPVTIVEMKRVSEVDYAKSLGLPKSEDYQLRDMLAAGQFPEKVNVSGMLDSQDPTDPQNDGLGTALFDKLSDSVEEPAPVPASEPAPEPAPVEPSNAE
jgi:hypothetical protein